MQNSARQGRGRRQKSKKKERGKFFPLVIIVILECDRNLIENHEADFLAFDVARSEGAIFNVSNSHFFISLFRSFLYLLYHTFGYLSIGFSTIF